MVLEGSSAWAWVLSAALMQRSCWTLGQSLTSPLTYFIHFNHKIYRERYSLLLFVITHCSTTHVPCDSRHHMLLKYAQSFWHALMFLWTHFTLWYLLPPLSPVLLTPSSFSTLWSFFLFPTLPLPSSRAVLPSLGQMSWGGDGARTRGQQGSAKKGQATLTPVPLEGMGISMPAPKWAEK